VMEHRQAILLGDTVPDVWRRSGGRYDALVAAAGADAVQQAERAVTLFHVDRLWRDHLALAADLREGIHLVALGGQDPLSRFTSVLVAAFGSLDETIDRAVLASLDGIGIAAGGLDLRGVGIKGPSSTWTYLVNDDPFRNQIGMLLTGPGRASVAVFSAIAMMPLLLLWGLVDRFLRKRPGRRPGSFSK
jgi:preprotein translocase subunit SecA